MHMRFRLIMLFIIISPTLAEAQKWTSPDGILSVLEPDSKSFEAVSAPPPPFIALWISHDEVTKLGILRTEIPQNLTFRQSSTEQGLAEETGGVVTRLPTKEISGHEVWSMTAKGPSFEITQAIIRHNDVLYKVMALNAGGSSDTVATTQFLDSLSIVAAPQSGLQRLTSREVPANQEFDLDQFSGRLGAWGIMLGLAIWVYKRTIGKKGDKPRAGFKTV